MRSTARLTLRQKLPTLIVGAAGGALVASLCFALFSGVHTPQNAAQPGNSGTFQATSSNSGESTATSASGNTSNQQPQLSLSILSKLSFPHSSNEHKAQGERNMRDPPSDVINSRPGVIQRLVAEVRRHAGADVRARCVEVIEGRPGSLYRGWAQAGQDWLLFHNYFWEIPYGGGKYIDIGSNHPEDLSNTFFFDRCLGWKGLCIEPNAGYHSLYAAHKRTCELVKNCLNDHEGKMFFKPEGTMGHLLMQRPKGAQGAQVVEVQCRRLPEVLVEHGFVSADLASIDIEGAEVPTLRCFPFHAFHIATWLVEVNKSPKNPGVSDVFLRGGYAHAMDVLFSNDLNLKSNMTRIGGDLDAVYRLQPSLVLGPDFLPGRALHQMGPRWACDSPEGCPQQVPVVRRTEMHWAKGGWRLKGGECRLPYPDGSNLSKAAFAHPLGRHPLCGVKSVRLYK